MPKIILDVKLYSLTEAADLLGVTRGTLTKYLSQQKLSSMTIGGRKYVSEDSLKKFLKSIN